MRYHFLNVGGVMCESNVEIAHVHCQVGVGRDLFVQVAQDKTGR